MVEQASAGGANSAALEQTIRRIVGRIAERDYDGALSLCASSRPTAEELRSAVQDYGRKPVLPPPDFMQKADAYPMGNGGEFIDVPVWTEEEGMSDLTLQFVVREAGDGFEVELVDLRVL